MNRHGDEEMVQNSVLCSSGVYHPRTEPGEDVAIKDYRPEISFSDQFAARNHDQRGDEPAAVAFLKELAVEGPALELAIGTVSIALPLAAEGIRVDGIDFSPEMVARLRAKPGGEKLSVQIADFVDVSVTDSYSLIFVIWNSLFNVLAQADQVRCFENVSAHLAEDGLFVVEAFVPTFLHRLSDHQQVEAESIDADEVRIGVLRHDPANQMLEQNHVTLHTDGARFDPVVQRYAWPSELDLMAQIAGLQLKDRWGGWKLEPYDADSDMHVSVYGR